MPLTPDVKSIASFIGLLKKTKNIIIVPKIERKLIQYFGSNFSILQGVINRFGLLASSNNSAVINNLVFYFVLFLKMKLNIKTKCFQSINH
jgi:hypothetical protein